MTKRDIQLAVDSYDSCIAFLDSQLGRLLGELKARGILDNTVVIITSDHGEGFGDHYKFGHMNSLYLDEIGVPLVILSPDAPKGQVVDDPVTLCDIPATIIDQLGLSKDSPFPGHSLANFWRPTSHEAPSAAISEMATGAAFGWEPPRAEGTNGYQLSLVASGYHYLRDGAGNEALHDLKRDPFESANLVGSAQASGQDTLERYRGKLWEFLEANPGSPEVENAYLRAFRQELKALLRNHSRPPATARK